MTARNIVHGGALNRLAQQNRVTVISYYGNQFEETLTTNVNGNISYEKIAIPRWTFPQIRGLLQILIERWEAYGHWELKRSITIWLYRIRPDWELNPTKALTNRLGGKLVTALRRNPDRDILRDFVYLIPKTKQLEKHDVVFVSSTNTSKDRQLIYSCKRYGIPVVALVHSWDNLTCKGYLPARPDRLLVWNEVMANEAHSMHDIPRAKIDVVGGPQYELYRTLAKTTSSTEFRERLDISPSTHIITYATNNEWIHPDEESLVEVLLHKVIEGYFNDSLLVLRLHPTSPRSELYRKKYNDSDLPIRFDKADSGFAASNTGKIGNIQSVKNFVALLQYSSAVINMASTITLDAICFDTPTICVGFNVGTESTQWNAATVNYLTAHFKRVAKSGAISLPGDLDEFFLSVLDAIENPRKFEEDRRKLMNMMIPNLPTSLLICESIEKTLSDR